MNTLGKKQEKQDGRLQSGRGIPTVIRDEIEDISLFKSIIASIISHALLFLLLYGSIILISILGLDFLTFKVPEKKIKDIEFILVNTPEKPPINKNTRFRSDRNSRAGGKHNPKKKISSIDRPKAVAKASKPKKIAPKKTVPKKVIKKQTAVKQPKQAKKVAPPKKIIPPKRPPQVIPTVPSRPIPNAFQIPAPVVKAPKVKVPRGGPVTSGPITSSMQMARTPAPMMSNDEPNNYNYAPQQSKNSSRSAYSFGDGNYGNPSPGNPTGAPGIDAIKEADFGPYMRDLQRKIKRNWSPPRGNRSKRVVLMFIVSKDGRLLGVEVEKSSGAPQADKAAIEAVELSAPFRRLPPEYRGDDIKIQFTFDYNVFGVGSGLR